jgi:hypothetical protein
MPKVHYVKKARKDNPIAKKGESYYWWKFAFGPRHFSKTRPKASQLTQSNYLSQIYAIQESISVDRFAQFDTISSDIEDIIANLQELYEECEESLYSMPEHLQDTSNSGLLLQERIDALDDTINELESIDIPEVPTDWSDEYSDWDELNDEDKEVIKAEWFDSALIEVISDVNDCLLNTTI